MTRRRAISKPGRPPPGPEYSTQRYPRRGERSDKYQPQKIRDTRSEFSSPILDEGFLPHQQSGPKHISLPTHFTSPPLIPGFLTSINDVLGPEAQPTPIQALSLKHLFDKNNGDLSTKPTWKQFLLASETGSGKSIAYLLPMLQDLKLSECQSSPAPQHALTVPLYDHNPRALILAPTHELSRQLAAFAKALLHVIKLRVMCASRANVKNTRRLQATASKMAEEYEVDPDEAAADAGMEIGSQKSGKTHPVDILVGTPTRLLEMVRGKGWNRQDEEERDLANAWDLDEKGKKIRATSRTHQRGEPEIGLGRVEWVVVDEADILFGGYLLYSFQTMNTDSMSLRSS
jgi:ATP-dependent RNA helicase MRH4